jgi:Lsr2
MVAHDARHFDIEAWTVHHHNMAKTVSVVVTDDLDGTPDAETVAFSVEGQSYEIDLGQKNLAKLQKSLQPFMDAGRRTALRKTARPTRGPGARIDRAAVRAWATAQGLQVSERGRISAEVMSKYEAAH